MLFWIGLVLLLASVIAAIWYDADERIWVGLLILATIVLGVAQLYGGI